MESRKQEVNIFKGTVSKVMGLKFAVIIIIIITNILTC